MIYTRILVVGVAVAMSLTSAATADDRLASYLDDQTFLVASAELDPAWAERAAAVFSRLAPLPEAARTQASARLAEMATVIRSLNEIGAREVAVVWSVNDIIPAGTPLFLVSVANDGDARSIAQKLQTLMPRDRNVEEGLRIVAQPAGNSTVLLGAERTLERYRSLEPAERKDLSAPLDELRKENAGAVVLSPGADSRRVIREIARGPLVDPPAEDRVQGPVAESLSEPSASGRQVLTAGQALSEIDLDKSFWESLAPHVRNVTGTFVADEVEFVAVAFSGPQDLTAKLIVQSFSEESAKTAEDAVSGLVEVTTAYAAKTAPGLSEAIVKIGAALGPRRDGATVALSLSESDPDIGEIVERLGRPAVAEASESAFARSRMHQMKQLALAMFNYESANKVMTSTAAIRDSEGKPLLSWRVAILPFLDEVELWKQFHYDEPWDSEHNLSLVKRMPDAFADPARPDLAAEGKTTYQLPVHPDAAFEPADGAEIVKDDWLGREVFIAKGPDFRDIIDGTSHTLMIVEVAAENAVPWTKPADWEVDFANLFDALRQEGRSNFVTAWMDGHAEVIDYAVEPEKLKATITRAGGEATRE